MTNKRSLFYVILLGAVCGFVPAVAQTALFSDSTAIGGSRVFSEGINPLSNSARFDQPKPGTYLTYLDGDQQTKDNFTIRKDLGVGGLRPSDTQISGALDRLADSPWAFRTKAYGAAYIAQTANGSYTHEDYHSFLAQTDTRPLASNSTADVRRAMVDRVTTGAGSSEQGSAYGICLRLERWKYGIQTLALNPTGSQQPLSGGPDPMQFGDASKSATTLALNFGFIYELAAGVRMGGNIDRINQKHLWDVYEKPQVRMGLQVDIGSLAKLSIESDINQAMRMPFPVNQRSSSASLRIAANPTLTFAVGAEQQKIGDTSVVRAGVSAQIRMASYLVGLGFQFGQDRPLKGATVAFY